MTQPSTNPTNTTNPTNPTNSSIKPYVNMPAWYFIKGRPQEGGYIVADPNAWAGPFAATITKVDSRNPQLVNVAVLGEQGNLFSNINIVFLQEGQNPGNFIDRYCTPVKVPS